MVTNIQSGGKGPHIDEDYIEGLLKKEYTKSEIDEILNKASCLSGLNHSEVAALLTVTEPEQLEKIGNVAASLKSKIYGNRVVIFAPIYVSDYCVNNCLYCGFNCKNKLQRKRLSQAEIEKEVQILSRMGHKRLALEAGEDPANCPIDYIIETIRTIYQTKTENGEIRRINVNIAATTVENYKKLKEAAIGTYILFQETYHRPTYEHYHKSGPKKDYDYHISAFDRAMEAGIDDVGGGALMGLYNPYFEVMGLMLHNEYLENKYNVGFHTISIPRIRKAVGAKAGAFEHALTDKEFLKIVAVLRLAVPLTGIIISTRESEDIRKQLLKTGVSQLSAGSSVDVGGYALREKAEEKKLEESQFEVVDNRKASDVISWIMDQGYVPSFCTACYRKGRTGDRFMELAKTGNIKKVCEPNSLLTLWEYANDYGDELFKIKAEKLIEKELKTIDTPNTLQLVKNGIEGINKGERDFYL